MSDLGLVHVVSAWVALGAGLANLVRPKGTRGHRALGWAFVLAMLQTNAVALSLYRLTGRFNLFHALALVSLAATASAMWPLARRRPGWTARHARGMQGAYAGLCAAAANEILTREVLGWSDAAAQFWPVSVLVSAGVLGAGAWLARRTDVRAAAE